MRKNAVHTLSELEQLYNKEVGLWNITLATVDLCLPISAILKEHLTSDLHVLLCPPTLYSTSD